MHALVTGERQGYYTDFGAISAVTKVLTSAYFHNGTWSTFRGRTHGRPVDALTMPAYRFVAFIQDHDQIGNRAAGDRLPATLADHPNRDGLLRMASGLLLTAPFTPMLFMGEEWGADTPWQFFTDHTDPDLAAAVTAGRRSEFAEHGWGQADVPDPQDKETFLRSKLDWDEPAREPYRSLLDWYRALLALRRSRSELSDPRLDQIHVDYDENARWLLIHRGQVRIAANLGPADATIPLIGETAKPVPLITSAPGISISPDAVALPPATFAILDLSLEFARKR